MADLLKNLFRMNMDEILQNIFLSRQRSCGPCDNVVILGAFPLVVNYGHFVNPLADHVVYELPPDKNLRIYGWGYSAPECFDP